MILQARAVFRFCFVMARNDALSLYPLLALVRSQSCLVLVSQMRGTLGNDFPRTAPRYETMIPAGRTGWMKLWTLEDTAISGVVINKSNGRFNQGHNLHSLTTTTTGSFTIPVFPAR